MWSAEGGRQEAAGPVLSRPQPVAKPLENTIHPVCRPRAVSLAAALLFVSGSTAFGQSLFSTSANVIATNGDAVPGAPVGQTFGGTSVLDTGVLADDGSIFFRGRILGGTIPTERALFYGSTRAGLQMVVRGGDPEPSGTIPGATLLSSSGASSGLSGSFRVSGNGTMLWASNLFGGGVTASNDSAYYVGTPGNFSIWIREGDAAPGTVGATLSSSFATLSTQQSGVDNAGRAWVLSSLAGGDVVGAANNEGLFTGVAGGLILAARRGNAGPGGELIADLAPGFIGFMNNSGQLIFDVSYVIGSGTTPVTTTNDRAIWIYTPGVGSQELIREGDPVTGFAGLTYLSNSNSPFNIGASNFNNAGELAIRADLSDGTAAIIVVSLAGGDSVIVRQGDPVAAIPGASFGTFNNASVTLNNAGDITFHCSLTGAVTTADDTAIFSTAGGSGIQLVAREGGAGPGTPWTFGSVSGQSQMHNGAGQVLFTNSMQTGGTPVGAYWIWTPGVGLKLMSADGDSVEVQPGVFKTLGTTGGVQFTNCNGRPLTFHEDGRISHRANFTDGSSAVLTVICPPVVLPVSYCTAGTTSNGCNATMAASGSPSVVATSGFTLSASNVEGDKQGLIFYSVSGRANVAWALGSTSFLCVKTPTQRTGAQSAGGTPGACDGALSVDWLAFLAANPTAEGAPFSAGTTVNAQAWFRDPPAPKTTNLSDGLEFVTLP